KAFEGKSQASLIGAILRDQPPALSASQPLAPTALDRVVRTCLEKDPDDRWQSAGDLARALRWLADEGAETTPARSSVGELRARPWWWAAAWIAVGVVLAAIAAWSWRPVSRAPAAAMVT